MVLERNPFRAAGCEEPGPVSAFSDVDDAVELILLLEGDDFVNRELDTDDGFVFVFVVDVEDSFPSLFSKTESISASIFALSASATDDIASASSSKSAMILGDSVGFPSFPTFDFTNDFTSYAFDVLDDDLLVSDDGILEIADDFVVDFSLLAGVLAFVGLSEGDSAGLFILMLSISLPIDLLGADVGDALNVGREGLERVVKGGLLMVEGGGKLDFDELVSLTDGRLTPEGLLTSEEEGLEIDDNLGLCKAGFVVVAGLLSIFFSVWENFLTRLSTVDDKSTFNLG